MGKKLVEEQLRRTIWERDGGSCQDCGKAVQDVADPGEAIIEAVLSLDAIPIYKWTKTCWKCKKPTTVATYLVEAGRALTLGDIQKLDFTLMAKYPFVKKQYSRPLETEVVANCCTECGAHQSNFYLAEDIAELVDSEGGVDSLVDATLPNSLQLDDFPTGEPDPEIFSDDVADIGHIHHKDADRHNNEPENLVLLCRACHLKRHSR